MERQSIEALHALLGIIILIIPSAICAYLFVAKYYAFEQIVKKHKGILIFLAAMAGVFIFGFAFIIEAIDVSELLSGTITNKESYLTSVVLVLFPFYILYICAQTRYAIDLPPKI